MSQTVLAQALLPFYSTKRSGTAFAMISLGLGELVGSSALILRSFFGGEEGVTTDRTKLVRLLGVSFGQQIEVSMLEAAVSLGTARVGVRRVAAARADCS